MFARSVCRALRVVPKVRMAPVAPRVSLCRAAVSVRFASNSQNGLPEEEVLKAQDLVSKLQQHPEIRQLLEEFQELIVSKGFNPEKPPSFMEMMRLFAHQDVCDLVSQLKVKFDEAGIKISRDDMGSLMKLFK